MPVESDVAQRVEAVRRFNRFYTKHIGVLHEGLLQSRFSLAEARVIYELAQHAETNASRLARELDIDPGYLSRILRRFEKQDLIEKRRSGADGRQSLLRLSGPGREAFALLNARSREEVGAMLRGLSEAEQARLVKSIHAIEGILGARPEPRVPYVLRPPRPGDLGWVVHRHGALYAAEYGFDESFEGLVAGIVAEFVRDFDPRRERCWIAEVEGEVMGSAFLVRRSETVAKLRLLLVEPQARGLGIGARLVKECEDFARRAGYGKITLWTNSVLHAARHIYERAGYVLVDEAPHHSFGQDLVGETWELALKGQGP